MFSIIELKIYYLYMLADGKCTEAESERFASICNSMDVDADDKEEVISFCEEAVRSGGRDNSTKIIRKITKLLADDENSVMGFGSINMDKETQTKIIWTLINLGYADVEYSDPEQKVVSFLADYWEMNGAVLTDMIDTAETILALTKRKEWIKTTTKPYDTINASISEIDKSIERMIRNVEILISEAEIA